MTSFVMGCSSPRARLEPATVAVLGGLCALLLFRQRRALKMGGSGGALVRNRSSGGLGGAQFGFKNPVGRVARTERSGKINKSPKGTISTVERV